MNFLQSFLNYNQQVTRCKQLDYFNYNELTQVDFTPPKHFNCVFLYGNHLAIEKLVGKKFNPLRDYLEHGVCFHDTIESARLMGYVNRFGIKNIYTCSYTRKNLIEKYLQKNHLHGRKVFTVGPYIIGTGHFASIDHLKQLKQQYGKILLVYPSHSIENRQVQYDVDFLISTINQYKVDFDSVFVCLYWKDIVDRPQLISKYQQAGFHIVCNGHRSDPAFLSRQKDLIALSDMMLTNGLGTHIGYAICMNTPVFFIKQNNTVTDSTNSIVESNYRFQEIEQSIYNAFCNYSFEITPQQIGIIKTYWGEWK